MKKLFLFTIALCISVLTQAQLTEVTSSGGDLKAKLEAAVGAANLGTITNLKVNGVLTAQDFTDLRSVANLQSVDMSSITEIANQAIPGGAFAANYFPNLETVILPEKHNGVAVITSIGNQAFQGTSSVASALKSVNIPDGVTTFGNSVFQRTGPIEHLVLPNSITTLGNTPFRYSFIKTITWPTSLTEIPANAFFQAPGLTSVYIPGNIKTIGSNAFNQASNLESVTIGEGVETINNLAFASTKVTSLTLPASLKTIGSYGLANFDLEQISYASGSLLETIGDDAFVGTKLTVVDNLPEGVKSIGHRAFQNTSTLTSINLPDGLESLGGSATFANTAISSIVIPANTQITGGVLSGTFRDAANLSSVTLNGNFTTIDQYTFAGTPLTELEIPEGPTEVKRDAFRDANIERLKLPNSVKTISGQIDRSGNSKLKILELGNNLESIAESAFAGLTALETLIVNTKFPVIFTTQTKVFEGIKKGSEEGAVTLHVPAESLTAPDEYDNYTTAPLWKDFMPNIQAIVVKQAQTIENFTHINKTTADDDFELSATATSGLAITYTITEGNGTVAELLSDGKTITIKGAGTAKIKASQAGNDEWEAAEDVEITLTVTQAAGLWDTKKNTEFNLQGNPVTTEARFSFESAGNGASIVIVDLTGKTVATAIIAVGSTEAVIPVENLTKGIYIARYTDNSGKTASLKLIK